MLARVVYSLVAIALVGVVDGSSSVGEEPFRAPVGITNGGNYCYMSALIQVLFHCPDVVRGVMQYESNSLAHMTLASLYYRLMTGKSAQDMDVDFYPAVEGLIIANGDNNRFFEPGSRDDVYSFYEWLIDIHLPWISKDLFTIRTETRLSYNGVDFSSTTLDSRAILVKLLEAPDQPIHKFLSMEEDVEYKIDLEEYKNEYLPDDREHAKDIRTRLLEAGVVEKATYNVIKRTEITNIPPILVVQASKLYFDPKVGRVLRDSNTRTLYEPKFSLNGTTYYLHGVVVYQELNQHYVAHVCVDAAAEPEVWYNLNDGAATRVDANADLGNDPYLFFYVEESRRNQWIQNGPVKVSEVPSKIKVLGQLFQALVDGKNLIRALTRQSAPFSSQPIAVKHVEKIDARRIIPGFVPVSDPPSTAQ